MSREQIVGTRTASFALAIILLAGCAGKGDVIPITLTTKQKEAVGVAQSGKNMAAPRVAVVSFDDARSDRTKVGSRNSAWGGESYFNVPSGSAGEEAAQAFADYLKRKGWQAQYLKTIPTANGETPDIVLSGKILDLAVDAKGGFGSTDLAARSKLAIHATNHADGSSITDTVSHSGTYNVFWFEPQDGEDILSEVLEKNFERFVLNTKFEDRSLRFR